MSSFCLLQITVHDAETLKQYTDAAPATAKEYGGELVFRGSVSGALFGQPNHDSAVVLRFPNPEAARSWYASDAYQALTKVRDASADVIVTQYDEPEFF